MLIVLKLLYAWLLLPGIFLLVTEWKKMRKTIGTIRRIMTAISCLYVKGGCPVDAELWSY